MKVAATLILNLFCLAGSLYAGDASRVEAVLLQMQQTPAEGVWYIEEDDLNAFLLEVLSREQRQEVQGVTVSLLEDSFRAKLLLDLDRILAGNGINVKGFFPGFTGVQELDLLGDFVGEGGVGRYRTLEASLSGTPLPATLVDFLLAGLAKELEPKLDLGGDFPLPQGLQAIELGAGKVTLRK